MYCGYEKKLTTDGQTIPNTTSSANNIYLNGVRVAVITGAGKTQYYLTDQVDSVKVVLNGDGGVVNRFEYLPYGES